jgi:hypothetical protein
MFESLNTRVENVENAVHDGDFEEIDLSNETGLDIFAGNTKELYEELVKLDTEHQFSEQLEAVLINFDSTIEKAHQEFRINQDLTDDTLDRLQGLYDQLVQLRERLIEKLKSSSLDTDEADTRSQAVVDEPDLIADSWASTRRSAKGKLVIEDQSDLEMVPLEIRVSHGAEKNINDHSLSENQPQLVNDKQISGEAVASLEEFDPINQAVEKPKTFTESDQFYSRIPLINDYLQSPAVQEFVNEKYGSTYLFEKDYLTSITDFENQSIDRLDKILGVKHLSPFDYYHDSTLQEFSTALNQPNLRQIITREGMKYETLLLWEDFLGDLITIADDDTTLGEAYLQWFIINRSQA